MRGGKRPGAGAKPKPEGDKVRRFLVSLSPEAAEKWEQVTPGERSAMVERMLIPISADDDSEVDLIKYALYQEIKRCEKFITSEEFEGRKFRIDYHSRKLKALAIINKIDRMSRT